MDPKSDLTHVVNGVGQPERANPVFIVDMRTYENLSGVSGAVGVPKMIFPQGDNTDQKRILGHVGTQGSLWYSFVDDEPAANKPGCYEMLPGDVAEIDTRQALWAVGTVVDIPYTALKA